MRDIDGKKFYKSIEELCNQSEDFGVDVLLPLTESQNSSQLLNENDLKLWFKNVGILGLTLHKLCYKSRHYPLGNSFQTINGGSLSDKLAPEVNKIVLSKRDVSAFVDIHHQIKVATTDMRKRLTHFEKQKKYAIPTPIISDFAIHAMEIPQKIDAVCRGLFYHFK